MFAIIGIVMVFGVVLGGYLMEHGHLKVLLQPAELKNRRKKNPRRSRRICPHFRSASAPI